MAINVYMMGKIRQKDKLEDFACDVINHYFENEPNREWNVFIKFVRKLDALGYCEKSGNDIMIEILNVKDIKEVASTLAHELVHAKQYIKRQLDEDMSVWCKQEIPYGPRGGCKIPYRQQPWEREAFDDEAFLTDFYWEN